MNKIIIKKITREVFSPNKPIKVTVVILNDKDEQVMDIVLGSELFPLDIKEQDRVDFKVLS